MEEVRNISDDKLLQIVNHHERNRDRDPLGIAVDLDRGERGVIENGNHRSYQLMIRAKRGDGLIQWDTPIKINYF